MKKLNTTCCHKDCSGRGDVFFRKITIQSIFGDDITGSMKPENGAYKNALVFYEASDVAYMYDSDGIYTKLTPTDRIDKLEARIAALEGNA